MYRVNEGIVEECQVGSDKRFLFLKKHDTFPLQWKVSGNDAAYLVRLGEVLSQYSTVSTFALSKLYRKCEELGYEVVFSENPTETIEWLKSLSGPTGVSIKSDLPGVTDEGFVPCQAQGINFVKEKQCAYGVWSPGVGKSVSALGLILWYKQQEKIDLVLYFAKKHNLINVQRGLKAMGDLDSVIVKGLAQRRENVYVEVARGMLNGDVPIVILNHEKFRDDTEALKMLVENRRVLVLHDEMGNKLGNHTTTSYKGASEVFYTSHTVEKKKRTRKKKVVSVEEIRHYYPEAGAERTKEIYHFATCATPIEHNPGQFFNQIHLMDPRVFGGRAKFYGEFTTGTDRFGKLKWNVDKLDKIGIMAADVIHQIDKLDPDIAKMFPEVLPPETIYLEMSKQEQWLYDRLLKEYEGLKKQEESIINKDEVLAVINVLEMICCNPISVLVSAIEYQKWMDAGADPKNKKGSIVAWKFRELVGNDKRFSIIPTKLLALQEILESDPEKFVVFTSLNDSLIPYVDVHLDDLEISHVMYHGDLTDKQKQESEDIFQSDPSVRVFFSSDAGKDSINLHAAAEVIHYNDPWSWAAKVQRQDRVNRINSNKMWNRYRTLRFAGTYEDRKDEVIGIKKGWHDGVFRQEMAEQARDIRGSDWVYVLFGDES